MGASGQSTGYTIDQSIRFEVRDGDSWGWDTRNDRERVELIICCFEKKTHWNAWSIYLPEDFPIIFPTKVAMGQFHNDGDNPPEFMFQNQYDKYSKSKAGGYWVTPAESISDHISKKLLDKLKPEVIQFDEPRFSRLPNKVEEWGIEALNICVRGIQCKTAVHVCYGYPQPGLSRPINNSYETIISLLEKSNVDQLALEFAGANLETSYLKNCPSKTVIFGCVYNSAEIMEDPKDMAAQLLKASEYIDLLRLQAAPDCGLVIMNDVDALKKLNILVDGSKLARQQI